MPQYFAEYGLKPAPCDELRAVPRRAPRRSCSASRRSRTGFVVPAEGWRSSPRPSSTPASCAAARATRRSAARRRRHAARPVRGARSATRWCTSSTASAATSGLVTLDLGDGATEFLQLEYAERRQALRAGRRSSHVIGRYSGAQPEAAPLHKLGSGQWEKAKAQRRAAGARHRGRAARPLRAARRARTGHAFALKPHDYEAFADGFGFEETPDQAAAIEAVIADMTSGKPMDRLVCGDVGFGKTEVALRAAFVARRRRQAGRGARARRRCSPSSTSRPSPTASPTGR